MKDYEKTYNKFWKDICEKDGEIDLEQIKKELHDFQVVMQEVTKVYDHITCGKFSKVTTDSKYIIEAVEEHFYEMINETADEAIKDDIDLTEESKYTELIMAVENKYPDESRHETALRYIREADNSRGKAFFNKKL